MDKLKKGLNDNLRENVLLWAESKGILNKEFLDKQILKKDEELGELATALFECDKDKIIDALGDIQVTLIVNAKIRGIKLIDNYDIWEKGKGTMYYYQRLHSSVSKCGFDSVSSLTFSKAFNYVNEVSLSLDLCPVDCLQVAYDVIRKRKTKTVNGAVLKV